MKEKKAKGRNLTEGDMLKTLFLLAAPMVLGMALQTGFNIIDTFFIGMLGSEELASISVTFPVVFIFIAIASGLAIGSTALVSQAIGARKRKKASNIALHSIIIGIITGTTTAVFGVFFSPPLFHFMGVSGHILEMTIQYANLIFFGFVFLFIGFIAQGIIQADGDTITPTRNLGVSVFLNIILDPLFIFGLGPVPAMGLVGAGLATVLARSVGAFLNIFHIFTNRTSIRMDMKYFVPEVSIFKRIVLIGFPSSLSNSINSIGMILLMSLVGAFGTSAIAAFGVGIRLESLAIMPIIGLSSAVIPFVGQNLGANRISRAKESISLASYSVIAFMCLFWLVWFFLPEIVYSPFTSDPDVLLIGSGYLKIISFGYIFMGLNFIMGAAFQGAGRTDLQLAVNLIRWISVISVAYFLVGILGMNGIWTGFPIGNFAGFLIAFTILKTGFWLRGWKGKGDRFIHE